MKTDWNFVAFLAAVVILVIALVTGGASLERSHECPCERQEADRG